MNIANPGWLPRTKPAALICLCAALLAQAIWLGGQLFVAHMPPDTLLRPLGFFAAFLLLALTRGNVRAIASLCRFVVATAFLLALWNRFDNFNGFIAFAGRVNSFMPRAIIPTLAVLATIGEVTCCIALFLGIQIRLAALCSSVLLCMFATAMTISGMSPFDWAVYVLSMGAWMLATVDASTLSLDSIFATKEAIWRSHVETR